MTLREFVCDQQARCYLTKEQADRLIVALDTLEAVEKIETDGPFEHAVALRYNGAGTVSWQVDGHRKPTLVAALRSAMEEKP